MTRPTPRKFLTWLGIAVLAGFAVYKLGFQPLPVLAHTLARGEIIAEVMGTGTLEARVKSTVSARIQERLSEVMADQGDLVKSGQLLATLDDSESQQQVAIAEATLAASRQTLERVRADLARSEAVLTQARLHQKRLVDLAANQAISQSDADKAAEALAVATADLNRSQAAIAEAQGQTVVAEKNLLFRKEQLAFTRILAPFDGLIIRRDRDAGDVLVPGASLMQIISLHELWVSAWIDETAMPALATEQSARVVFRSTPGHDYPGTVTRLGREADRETREFLVDVRATDLPQNWAIGQRAEVFIETERVANAVRLPVEFVLWKNGQAGVFIDAGGKTRWREITIGLRGMNYLAVINGVAAGDRIIKPAAGAKKTLSEGQRIAQP